LLAQAKNLASKEPVHEGNAQTTTVVGWDGNIDVWERRVAVAESNGGDVDVRALDDGLERERERERESKAVRTY
jgi:hypothetical protein